MLREQLSFFNTSNESGKELEQSESKAYSQEAKVLRCFLYGNFTALEIAEKLDLHESSARRCCTNLATKGLLIKTNEQRIGKYGKRNYIFKLK